MTIEISQFAEARLKAKAQAEGISIAEYVERLVRNEDDRAARLTSFRAGIDERLESLNRAESEDGEQVMARLIAELDGHALT